MSFSHLCWLRSIVQFELDRLQKFIRYSSNDHYLSVIKFCESKVSPSIAQTLPTANCTVSHWKSKQIFSCFLWLREQVLFVFVLIIFDGTGLSCWISSCISVRIKPRLQPQWPMSRLCVFQAHGSSSDVESSSGERWRLVQLHLWLHPPSHTLSSWKCRDQRRRPQGSAVQSESCNLSVIKSRSENQSLISSEIIKVVDNVEWGDFSFFFFYLLFETSLIENFFSNSDAGPEFAFCLDLRRIFYKLRN